MTISGRTLAHPKVEAIDDVKSAKLYRLNVDDYPDFGR